MEIAIALCSILVCFVLVKKVKEYYCFKQYDYNELLDYSEKISWKELHPNEKTYMSDQFKVFDDFSNYELKPYFLTYSEHEFYKTLREYITRNNLKFLIIPHVNLKEFINIKNSKYKNKYTALFNRIKANHVDFLVFDYQLLHPVLAIEIDDSSHDKVNRIVRDEFVNGLFKHIGLELVHLPSKENYSEDTIKNILDFIPPKQPHKPMTTPNNNLVNA